MLVDVEKRLGWKDTSETSEDSFFKTPNGNFVTGYWIEAKLDTIPEEDIPLALSDMWYATNPADSVWPEVTQEHHKHIVVPYLTERIS